MAPGQTPPRMLFLFALPINDKTKIHFECRVNNKGIIMHTFIKRLLGIAVAALFFVMMGHLILDITSENVADNSSDSKDKSFEVVNN